MDTHVTTTPDINERIGAPLGSPIRLPGRRGTLPHLEDHDLDPGGGTGGEPASAAPGASEPREKLVATTLRPGQRLRLLSTAAVVVVLVGIGGAAWSERQGALNLPLPPKMVSFLRTGLPFTTQVAAEVVATPLNRQSTTPTAMDPSSERFGRAARQQAEFASFKSGDDAVAEVGAPVGHRSAITSMPATPASPTQIEPASAAVAPALAPAAPPTSRDTGTRTDQGPSTGGSTVAPPITATAAVASIATIVPNLVAPAPPIASVPSPALTPMPNSRDSIQAAINVRAEPLSPKQQVEVVGLVRELGAQLKESRLTVAQMQATVADLKEQLDNRMTEFDGRLGLAEAGTVLAQSARAGLPQSFLLGAATPIRPLATGQRQGLAAVSAPASAAPSSRSVKDLRVQGASPGLAVLNVIGAAPGEAPVLYVALGDQVPGIGRIKSIYQRGTTWLVQTDAGLIQ